MSCSRRFCPTVASLTVAATLWAGVAAANYPIFSQRYTADPSPLVQGDRVYVFSSHDLDEQTWWDMEDFTVISSVDLVNWTDHGEVFHAGLDTSWATRAWAPAVVERDGRFWMYYTNARDGTGVAVADELLGPYTDPLGQPLVLTGNYSDPAVLVDTDGTYYLHLKHTVWSALNPDMVSLAAVPRGYAGSSFPDYKEGGILHIIDGRYNLSYVTDPLNGYGWSYAQSTSDSPTQDFTFQDKWFWLSSDNDPNSHGDLFELDGQHYFVYHNAAVAMARGEGSGFQRSIAIDRLYLNGDGTFRYFTSTRDLMPQRRYLDPYVRTEAETMAAESGIETEPCSAGGRDVTEIQDGDWLRVAGVDFGSGATSFTAMVASATSGGTIELRLDDPDGRLIATCAVPGTGGWQTWRMFPYAVTGATGVHDLYFRFSGGAGSLFNIDWWRFDGGTPAGRLPPETIERTVCLRPLGDPAAPDQVYLQLDNRDGTWSFQALPSREFLAVVDDVAGTLGFTPGNGPSARFVLVSNPDGSWCLRGANARFVVADNGPMLASFDETTSGSPRLLPGDQALFEIADCTTGTAIDCSLDAIDLATPSAAALTTAYGSRCQRVDRTLAEGRTAIPRPGVVANTPFDTASPDPAGSLTLYQLDCGCDATLRLTRDAFSDTLVFR